MLQSAQFLFCLLLFFWCDTCTRRASLYTRKSMLTYIGCIYLCIYLVRPVKIWHLLRANTVEKKLPKNVYTWGIIGVGEIAYSYIRNAIHLFHLLFFSFSLPLYLAALVLCFIVLFSCRQKLKQCRWKFVCILCIWRFSLGNGAHINWKKIHRIFRAVSVGAVVVVSRSYNIIHITDKALYYYQWVFSDENWKKGKQHTFTYIYTDGILHILHTLWFSIVTNVLNQAWILRCRFFHHSHSVFFRVPNRINKGNISISACIENETAVFHQELTPSTVSENTTAAVASSIRPVSFIQWTFPFIVDVSFVCICSLRQTLFEYNLCHIYTIFAYNTQSWKYML